ncbi:Gfo/Idh/MocA family oxidoreductase [Belnapia sp. T18]|uniref:Gfo/Idh/MocA family oxidoreductase n=1 Tax=Belnapia arida TaxID=2804533 RepID=A0ABS1U1R2_9PROT|nr:Gfo/Idh/MocA family oxidoreductase [Belnapia arida]MBL6078616.1 Gfo/Idh/MocA family oxidoreductase [Belnapia arida]
MADHDLPRRGLVLAAAALGAGGAGYPPPSPIDSGRVENGRVQFPDWRGPADPPGGGAPQPQPPGERIGFAVVGLGRISLEEVLPALAECREARPVALVSGSPEKARVVAAQHGIPDTAVHGYDEFERLRENPAVQAVYIALPNAMHREFTERAAAIGRHVLCEKPMANSLADCQAMTSACERAGVRLMIAYRSQYQPHHRATIALIRSGELGRLRFIEAANTQANGPGPQWRYNRQMAGGGALPDIGLYCLNAARYLTGEEPVEAFATTYSPAGDARFAEVEESIAFQLRFPSGVIANALSSYGTYENRSLRLHFERGSIEMPHAFAYQGQRLVVQRRVGEVGAEEERIIKPKNQFAQEIDHFAACVRDGRKPHTPGEEGVQDQALMEALYRSAKEGKPMRLEPPPGPTRGPDPA